MSSVPPAKTNSLSNTIALEAYLIDRGVPGSVARAVCMDIGRMAEKIVFGSAYILLGETDIEKPMERRDGTFADLMLGGKSRSYKEVLSESLGKIIGSEIEMDYIGVHDLCQTTRDEARREQMLVYRMTRDNPIRKALDLHGGTRRARSAPEQDHDYNLREEIKLAIGTHKLRRILDARVGNVFSKVIKDNIVDLWFGYLRALIKMEPIAAEYASVCETQRVMLTLGHVKDNPKRWITLINSNKSKRIS